MKILMFSLLLALGLNANEVVYGSASGEIKKGADGLWGKDSAVIVQVAVGETIEILNVTGGEVFGEEVGQADFLIQTQHEGLPSLAWQNWQTMGSSNGSTKFQIGTGSSNKPVKPQLQDMVVGPCSVLIKLGENGFQPNGPFVWQVSYKLTKPASSNTTTSAPILLPPTPNAAASWFVKLQMSSDLKTWEDVQAGQFLGSDAARFFRIQTTAAE